MDLVSSLSVEELVTALRNGQIREESEISQAFARIAEFDSVLALELLRELPSRTHRDSAQIAILEACLKSDPAGFYHHLKTLEAGEHRARLIDDFVSRWGKQDPSMVLSLQGELDEIAHHGTTELFQRLLSDWAKRDFEAAEEWVVNSSNPSEKKALMDSLELGRFKKLRRGEAVDFILERSENATLQEALLSSFQDWVISEPKKALVRFSKLPKEHSAWRKVEAIGSRAMLSNQMRKADPNQVLEWAEIIPEGTSRREFLMGAIKVAMGGDIETGERLFKHLPESPERAEAARTFVEYKMRQDPVGLGHWLGELEPSATRDEAVSRFTDLLKNSDPERAREWAETIANEKVRSRSLNRLEE